MRTVTLILLVLLLAVLVSCLAAPDAPAHAQEPFQTPTPLPAVQATLAAAPVAQQAAQDSIQQAAQLEAQAAELRRNGIAQQQQAAQALSDARAASVAQNALAIGEAMGRADSNLNELRKTNAAQNDMIATLIANQKIQSAAYISKSLEADGLRDQLQQAESQKQTIQANYDDALKRNEGNSSTNGFIWLVAAALLIALIAVVLIARRRNGVTITHATAEIIEPPEDDDRMSDEQ